MMKYRWRNRSWKRKRGRVSELEISTKQGKFIVSTRDNSISRQLYAARAFDLREMESATRFLRTEGLLEPAAATLLLDVGATIGVICIGMVHNGMAARAIAIEAEPKNYDLLRRNVSLNKLESVVACVFCAVSAADGVLSLRLNPGTNMGDHRVMSTSASISESPSEETVTVPARRLDDVVREQNGGRLPGRRECLIWMDIQGHESFAIEGATNLMEAGIAVYVELWPHGLDRWGGGLRKFTDLAQKYWTEVIQFEGDAAVRRPIADLPLILEKIGDQETSYSNALLIRK